MNKAVFLDRDGVLIKTNIINGKPHAIRSINEFELIEDVQKQLNILKGLGYILIVVTNQPDVKRGLTSKKILEQINKKLELLLPIDQIRVCAEEENENTGYYKPKPGMLVDAAKEYNIDLKNSFIIGDRWRDVGAGFNAGCKTIFIDYQYSEKLPIKPNYIVQTITKAVEVIVNS